jgi:hypothetical protein
MHVPRRRLAQSYSTPAFSTLGRSGSQQALSFDHRRAAKMERDYSQAQLSTRRQAYEDEYGYNEYDDYGGGGGGGGGDNGGGGYSGGGGGGYGGGGGGGGGYDGGGEAYDNGDGTSGGTIAWRGSAGDFSVEPLPAFSRDDKPEVMDAKIDQVLRFIKGSDVATVPAATQASWQHERERLAHMRTHALPPSQPLPMVVHSSFAQGEASSSSAASTAAAMKMTNAMVFAAAAAPAPVAYAGSGK